MAAGLNPEENNNDSNLDVSGANDFYTYKKKQRKKIAALVFLGMLAILIFVFSFIQMSDILEVPLPGGEKLADALKRVEGIEIVNPMDETDDATLKLRDTDQDSLTDFDELKIYLTSPYLADTDSDGVSDIVEIKAGEDPSCPAAQNCFRTAELYAEASQEQTEIEADLNITAEQIRALLKESGKFTADQIGLFTDKELLDFYTQMVAENPELAAQMGVKELPVGTVVPPKTPAQIMAEVDTVPIEEIKSLLRQQGVSDSDLSQIDDATLRELYKKAYEEANKKIK